jgi:hypothetical protein
MKNLVICLLAFGGLLPALNSNAQSALTEDFESWSTVSGVEVPDNWVTSDQKASHINNNYHTVFKSTDSHTGNYALKLKSINSSPDYADARASAAFAVSGVSRPQYLTGYYKSSMDSTDSFFIYVNLYKSNGTAHPVLAGYIFNTHLALAATYTSFSIPVTYLTNDDPDSGYISFWVIQNGTNTTHEVFIDDLGLTAAGIAQVSPEFQGSLYPNPARAKVTYTLTGTPNGKYTVTLHDMMGRVLNQVYEGIPIGKLKLEIDLQSYPAGVYLLDITANEKRQVIKILKE